MSVQPGLHPSPSNPSATPTATTSGTCLDSPQTGTGDIDTELPDLSSTPTPSQDWVITQEDYDSLVRNIIKPRYNLGGNGPPGRTD